VLIGLEFDLCPIQSFTKRWWYDDPSQSISFLVHCMKQQIPSPLKLIWLRKIDGGLASFDRRCCYTRNELGKDLLSSCELYTISILNTARRFCKIIPKIRRTIAMHCKQERRLAALHCAIRQQYGKDFTFTYISRTLSYFGIGQIKVCLFIIQRMLFQCKKPGWRHNGLSSSYITKLVIGKDGWEIVSCKSQDERQIQVSLE
jgi:hypothetical protein